MKLAHPLESCFPMVFDMPKANMSPFGSNTLSYDVITMEQIHSASLYEETNEASLIREKGWGGGGGLYLPLGCSVLQKPSYKSDYYELDSQNRL